MIKNFTDAADHEMQPCFLISSMQGLIQQDSPSYLQNPGFLKCWLVENDFPQKEKREGETLCFLHLMCWERAHELPRVAVKEMLLISEKIY